MNVILILLYVFAAIVLATCILLNMRRSVLRGCAALGAAVIAAPVAVLLTKLLVGGMASAPVRVVNPLVLEELAKALPSFEQTLPAIVRMAVAPAMYLIVFILVYALLAVAAWLISRLIEKKKPEAVKNNKPLGAAIGAVLGFVLVIACLVPVAGYTSMMPDAIGTLEAVENVLSGNEEQTVASDVADAQKLANTPLLKVVRVLGGDLMIDSLTTVTVDGEKTNLPTEAGTLAVIGQSANSFVGVHIMDYTDEQAKAIEELANVIEPTVLSRVLGAESLSSISHAWLKGETFLGIKQPDRGPVSNAAYIVLMEQTQHMTAETMEQDLATLGDTLMKISKIFKVYRFVEAGMLGDHPGREWPSIDPSTLDATVEDAEALLAEVLADQATKRIGIEITVRVIAGEILAEEALKSQSYGGFIDGMTELLDSDAATLPAQELAERVKAVRDASGIVLSDEECEALANDILASAYNVFYK